MEDFPFLKSPAIIALKGLPVTFKTPAARIMAKMSGNPVLFIEDFLALEAAPQSKDEALYRAFNALCKVAEEQARSSKFNYVVIKSHLSSTFEFDRLVELMIKSEFHALLIISWYIPDAWNDVEMASDDYDAQAWDYHFHYSISRLPNNKQHLVRRLTIDIASATSSIWEGDNPTGLKIPFFDVIRYLLKQEAMFQLPQMVDFDAVQRLLLELELDKPRERSEYLCRSGHGCVFKYREALECDSCCGVCEKPVSGSVYACYKCILILHKSCAEEPKMVDVSNPTPYWDRGEKYEHLPKGRYYRFDEKHACDFCKKSGESFSYNCRSCLFQTHLKCRVMPTIVKHVCHPEHFLSIWIKPPKPIVEGTIYPACKGCHKYCVFNGYVCVICNYTYHVRCIAAPGETKHEHGGYEHVMKLWYSYDGMEEEENFWCGVCYTDMNKDLWFYRCKECPYYISHMDIRSHMPCEG